MLNTVTKLLIDNKDDKYKLFTEKLVPDSNYEVLGVRVPKIKEIAKFAVSNGLDKEFINTEKKYYEEWFTHGIILGYAKISEDERIKLLEEFLPHVDNWAICDSVSACMKVFKKNKTLAFDFALKCLKSDKTYTVRFALDLFIDYFLEEKFVDEIINLTKVIKSDEYYINICIAWLYSVIAVKFYDKILPLFEEKSLPKFIQNKSIQKIKESFRISDDKKIYLNTLKI